MNKEQKQYLRFGAMIATSMVLMYAVMYANTYQLSHVEASETRLFMTLLMGSAMAIVMLMSAMVPHHSIAILTSENAEIKDVRVCRLAVEIIKAQQREIKEMQWLMKDISKNGHATSRQEADQRPVPEFAGSSIRKCE